LSDTESSTGESMYIEAVWKLRTFFAYTEWDSKFLSEALYS